METNVFVAEKSVKTRKGLWGVGAGITKTSGALTLDLYLGNQPSACLF
jgi:hypothetical protein